MGIENISYENNRPEQKQQNTEAQLLKILNSSNIPESEKEQYKLSLSNLDKQKNQEINEALTDIKSALKALKDEIVQANNIDTENTNLDYSNPETLKKETQQALLNEAKKMGTLDDVA